MVQKLCTGCKTEWKGINVLGSSKTKLRINKITAKRQNDIPESSPCKICSLIDINSWYNNLELDEETFACQLAHSDM